MKSSPDSPRRHVGRLTIDIVVSVIILAFGAVLALTVLTYAGQFGGLTAECGNGPFTGLECNSTALSIAVFVLIAVTILSYFLAIGMVIVSLIRKKVIFPWPLGGVILIIVAFYIAAWVAGMTVPTGAGS
ncbi:uncharacterized BrkB/YihY/UPF0761 family membrane protein [Salinibacterium sp. CAN_S4]|uniref:hypothetical protein n=1 Tax=Salinibacterium sp. CAN_S4 TaxID=2787727 RepID=UPI0018F00FE5